MLKLILTMFVSSQLYASSWLQGPRVGLELAGAPTFLLSDISSQAFGLGLGHVIGLHASSGHGQAWGLKLRADRMFFRQDAVGRTDMGHYVANTRLKAMEQNWTVLALGVEYKQAPSDGVTGFYELLFGYAISRGGAVELTPENSSDTPVLRYGPSLYQGFLFMPGTGIRRAFADQIYGLATMRTLFLIGNTYGDGLSERFYMPFPIILSVGAEYAF